MKKLGFGLFLVMLILVAAVPQARGYTVFDRTELTLPPKGEIMILYTLIINSETDNPGEEIDKFLNELLYKIYPGEAAEISPRITQYLITIFIKSGGETRDYIEWPVDKKMIDLILKRQKI